MTFQHQAPVVQFIALPASIRDDGPGDSGAWVGHDEGLMWESQVRAVDPCNMQTDIQITGATRYKPSSSTGDVVDMVDTGTT